MPRGQESLALDELIRKTVLPRFAVRPDAAVSPWGGGLINETFLVSSATDKFVLQRVNALFPSSIHHNIGAVTAALAAAGLVTPTLIATVDGAPCLQLPASDTQQAPSVWRLLTFVAGVSFDVVAGAAQAHAAGALVARFHAALDTLGHTFVGLRGGIHDTPRHLEALKRAIGAHPHHRLYPRAEPLARRILDHASKLRALPVLPPRICHGDLKFNNFLFAGSDAPDRDHAVCLIDLDTVGPMSLAYELGDAWRSWCNRTGEDREEASLDLDIFVASLDGYQVALGRRLSDDERRALLLAPEWISLELAARFAADAVAESYFGWDPARFSGRGEHNLVRATGQLSLHEAFAATREKRARLLQVEA